MGEQEERNSRDFKLCRWWRYFEGFNAAVFFLLTGILLSQEIRADRLRKLHHLSHTRLQR